MVRLSSSVVILSFILGCGGEPAGKDNQSASTGSPSKSEATVDACTLLTVEEIEAVAGWKPGSPSSDTYGTTSTCTYPGPKPTESIVLVLARPAPGVASSEAMADWRRKQVERQPDLKMTITPVEGLGVPAVQSQLDGTGTPTLELAKGGRMLGITAPSFDLAKALAPKAAARLPS
jgi:hypothetical protein